MNEIKKYIKRERERERRGKETELNLLVWAPYEIRRRLCVALGIGDLDRRDDDPDDDDPDDGTL